MSFHLSVKVISIYQKCLYIPAEESMACSSLVAHGLCFLKTVSTPKEHSSLWLHHYSNILKTAQLWRKINSNGWKRELVPVSVFEVVGDLSPWGLCHKPVLGIELLALTALCQLCWAPRDFWTEMFQPCSCILKTAALQRWNTYGISSCSFGLLYNSTRLNWDFTFLLITWEGFLLLGLLGAVPWAVLVPALLQSNQGCDLCVCLPPPVITERLLGGRMWIRAEFHRSCSIHPGNSCLAASGSGSNWCLAAWIGDCKVLYYIFLCASLSQLLQSELLQPGLESSLESSVLQELSWGVTWCICHLLLCSVQGLGWKYQASSFPTFLYKKRGLQWKLLSFFYVASLLCDTCSLLGNTETSFPKFRALHLQTGAGKWEEVRRSFTSFEGGDWRETRW